MSKQGLSSVLFRSSGFIETFRPGPLPPLAVPLNEIVRRPKTLIFHWFLLGFSNLFRFFCDLSAILDHHGLQDASKTSKIASKTPPRSPKRLPRGFQTPPRRPRSLPRRLQGCPTGFQMPSWLPTSPLSLSRRPPEASRCLPDAQYRFQDRPKCSVAV